MSTAALHLFRSLLRAGSRMPTENRVAFVKSAARRGFEEGRGAAAAEVPALLQLAELQLETVKAQAAHLAALQKQGHLKS
jgi:hypothetical protein